MNNQKVLVLLWKYREGENQWWNLLQRLICYFTASEYVHAEIYVNGCTYGMNDVCTKRVGVLNADEIYEPVNLPSDEQLTKIYEYVENAFLEKRRYNTPKLISMALIYNTRFIWRLLGWVPFSAAVFGSVCSVFVDRAFLAAGIDLLPGEREGYTAPCDLAWSNKLRRVIR